MNHLENKLSTFQMRNKWSFRNCALLGILILITPVNSILGNVLTPVSLKVPSAYKYAEVLVNVSQDMLLIRRY